MKISHLPKAQEKHKRIIVITQVANPVCVAEDGKMKLYPMMILSKDKLVDTNRVGTNLLLLVFKCFKVICVVKFMGNWCAHKML